MTRSSYVVCPVPLRELPAYGGGGARASRVVMPFNAPGLALLNDSLDEQQLAGLFGKLKKGVKKIVKSKAFKVAAIGTAAYFAGPAIAAKMGAAGLGKAAAAKFVAKRVGGAVVGGLKRRRKLVAAVAGTAMAGAAPGSVAAQQAAEAEAGAPGLTPMQPSGEGLYVEPTAAAPPAGGPTLAGMFPGGIGTMVAIGAVVLIASSLTGTRRRRGR